MNIAGFLFTFAIGTAWGSPQIPAGRFLTDRTLLGDFFLFYLGISILFTLRQSVKLTGYIDGTLIFGTPIVVFSLQAAMMHDQPMSLAYSAIALSALYLLIAYASKAPARRIAITIGRIVHRIGRRISDSGDTTGVGRALECRHLGVGGRCAHLGGMPAKPTSAASLWRSAEHRRGLRCGQGIRHRHWPLGATLRRHFRFTCAKRRRNFLGAHVYTPIDSILRRWNTLFPMFFTGGVLFWWVVGGFNEVHQYVPTHALPAALVLVTVTSLGSGEIYRRTELGAARIAALLQLPAMLAFAAYAAIHLKHPSAAGGWWAWPIAFGGLYYLIFRHEGAPREPLANRLNAVAAWAFCALLSWELAWQVNTGVAGGDTWWAAAWAAIPAVLLWRLPRLVTRVNGPLRETAKLIYL